MHKDLARPERPLDERVASLRRIPPRPRIAAIESALPLGSDDERSALAAELLELSLAPQQANGSGAIASLRRLVGVRTRLRSDEALGAMARTWAFVPEGERKAALAGGRGRWARIASDLESSDDRDETLARCAPSYALLARECLDPSLAPLLLSMVRSGTEDVARVGERALIDLACVASGHDLGMGDVRHQPLRDAIDAPIDASREAREQLVRAIADGVFEYAEHRRRDVLLGALVLLAAPPARVPRTKDYERLARLLDEGSHPSAKALRGVIRWHEAPVVRRCAFEWIVHRSVSVACVDRLGRARSPGEHEAVLERAHLLLNPLRAAPVGSLRVRTTAKDPSRPSTLSGPCPAPPVFASMSATARRGLSRWLDAIDADEPARRAALAPVLADPDASVRLATLPRLASESLDDFSFDADERVASNASLVRSVVPVSVSRPSPLSEGTTRLHTSASRLSRSPYARVRRIASDDAGVLSPLAGTPGGRLLAWRALRADRPGLIKRLRAVLREGDDRSRIAGVQVTRRLGLASELLDELLEIVASKDRAQFRLVATAVGALADAPTDDAQAIVLACTRHEDDRVRANALESLARHLRLIGRTMDNSTLGRLVELKADAHHRVRSTSIRVLLDGDDSADSVKDFVAMLDDSRPMHRVAGVWLAERTLTRPASHALDDANGRVRRCAELDPDASVRRRAARLAARLDTQNTQTGAHP